VRLFNMVSANFLISSGEGLPSGSSFTVSSSSSTEFLTFSSVINE